MDDRTKEIMAQTAYKCASWLHAAEVQTGAMVDPDHLHDLARKVANGMFKLAGPSSAQAGGSNPQRSPRAEGVLHQAPSVPSCPKCNEPMEPNKNWTGLGDQPGHKRSESIKWRCSMRGRFVKDKGWSGCDGVVWEDAAA